MAAPRGAAARRPRAGGGGDFIQRFGGLVNLNVHFHVLVADGVFARGADGTWRFHELPAPTDAEVATLCARIARRVRARLARWTPDEELPDGAPLDQLQAVAAQLPLPGYLAPLAEAAPPRPRHPRRCARVEGFSLHANRHVQAHSRAGLEALCRYGARPPVALARLARDADGQVVYHLKQSLADGRRALRFPPVAFLRRLCALVPPPRSHLVRYHGVLAPRAAGRATLVPPPAPLVPPAATPPAAIPPRARIPWADLLRRVFAIDVLACPCGGRRQVLAFLTQPAVVTRILAHLGLPSAPPPCAPARSPPGVLAPDWDGADPPGHFADA